MQEDARKTAADGAGGAKIEPLVQRFSPLPTGTRVGDLVIQSVLGAGAFGITYIAVPEGSNRRFVIKEYLPRALAFRDGLTVRVSSANAPLFAGGLDRFLNEARALAKIRHPAVIAVQSVSEANGTGYMVMTHEVGRDLGIWLHELRRPLTQQDFDQLLEPLLEGLQAMHSKDVHHLDLQPANILVRENGSPVLIDLGGGRLALRRKLNQPMPADALPYMAPEVLAGDQNLIGASSDIYALAGVLYMLATGQTPPEASRRVLRDELVPTADASKSKLRPSFLQAIDQGLKYRPDDRPQSVASWQEDLLRKEPAPLLNRKQAAKALEAEAKTGDAKSNAAHEPPDYATEEDAAEPLMENPAFRPLFFGMAGAVCGALAGALSSILIASIVWSSCASDSCVAPVVPYTTAIGALVGLIAGARYGKQTASGGKQTFNSDTEF